MTSPRTWRILSIVLVIAIVFGAVTMTEAYVEQHQAQSMVSVFAKIQVGKTTKETAEELTRGFGRYRVPKDYADGRGHTADQFAFANRVLEKLRIPIRAIVYATLSYQDGIVVGKHIQCAGYPRYSGSIGESVSPTIHAPGNPPDGEPGRDAYIGDNDPSRYPVIQVRDDTTVSAARRQLDWQIDLSCMTALHGCNDPRKVLVGAFQNLPTR